MNILSEIYSIVVLYNCKVSESETLKTLNQVFVYLNVKLNVLIYDNTIEKDNNVKGSTFNNLEIEYYHNPFNPGVAAAYNLAIEKGIQNKKKWLILLDQDTTISKSYFKELISSTSENILKNDIVCYIPKVVLKTGEVISPSKMKLGGFCQPLKNRTGLQKKYITAINSGTVLNLTFLESIGGFTNKFPLDMLDHWYFREIYSHKKMVYILNTEIIHDLSIKSFESSVSAKRYRIILDAEKEFYNSYLLNFAIYKYRLCLRLIKQLFYKDKVYFKLSLKALIHIKLKV